jgi:hypothetical protein
MISKNPEERSLALECLGVLCLMDEEWASTNTVIIQKYFVVDLSIVKVSFCLSIYLVKTFTLSNI